MNAHLHESKISVYIRVPPWFLKKQIMNTNEKTRFFGVLGHPVGHSLSPAMHNAAFEALGWNAVYAAFDICPEQLIETLRLMRTLRFEGVNLTIPLKETAFQELSSLDASTQLPGAVNTIKFNVGNMIGYNTDGYGFVHAFEEAFTKQLKAATVFVLGTGGAGRAIALACAQEGAGKIVLANRTADRAHTVMQEIRKAFPHMDVDVAPEVHTWNETAKQMDMIIQTTSMGMNKEDPCLLGPEAFRKGQCVMDLIYIHPETRLMSVARGAGADVANGLDMLLYQGMKSFEIWTSVSPPEEIMRAALRKAVQGSLVDGI